MVKRLFTLVLALALAGSPVALEACQIACSSTLADPMTAHDTHQGHHHHATPADGSGHESPAAPHHLSPQVPPCDHAGDTTIPSVTAARTSDGVLLDAVAVPPIEDVVLAGAATGAAAARLTLPDRLEIRLASSLRI